MRFPANAVYTAPKTRRCHEKQIEVRRSEVRVAKDGGNRFCDREMNTNHILVGGRTACTGWGNSRL